VSIGTYLKQLDQKSVRMVSQTLQDGEQTSGLRMDILTQGGIDRRLVFGMPAFEPFQNISVKPQGHMPFDGTIKFAPHSVCPVEDLRDVGKIYVLVLSLLHIRYLFLNRRDCNLVHIASLHGKIRNQWIIKDFAGDFKLTPCLA